MTTHLLIGDVRRQRRSCQKTKQKKQNKTTTTTQFVSDVPEPISAQRRHRSTFQPVFFLILLILSARSAWVGVVLTPLLAGVRGASPRQLGASVCACPRAGAWSGRETIASTERKGGGGVGRAFRQDTAALLSSDAPCSSSATEASMRNVKQADHSSPWLNHRLYLLTVDNTGL